MCGISALFSSIAYFCGALVKGITHLIRHRGPDVEGYCPLAGDGFSAACGGKDTPDAVYNGPTDTSPRKRSTAPAHRGTWRSRTSLPQVASPSSAARLWFFYICSTILLTSGHILAHCDAPSSYIEEVISEVTEVCFTNISRNDIKIEPIKGGHSNTALKISTGASNYVLRIQGQETSLNNLERELYAMEAGMRLGVSPKIYYVSADRRGVLMEYIPKSTLSWSEARDPLNCMAIAQAIFKVHTTEKNPFVEETINETAYKFYNAIANTPEVAADLDEAVKLMERYTVQLESLSSQKVNIHGDLNSRNIFLVDREAFFIDWEYTGWEDPFFDLSYYAIRLDYNLHEEMLLLNSYLQRLPTEEELQRYSLTKKIHLSQFCVFFYYFSLKFNRGEPFSDYSYLSHNFSYYMKKFSDNNGDEEGLAQFYYDLAKICLELARVNSANMNTIH